MREAAMKSASGHINQPDVLAGILIGTVGVAGLWFGASLSWGTASAMGSGYLPLALSWTLLAIAVVLSVRGLLRQPEKILRFSLWPALVLTVATIIFGLVLEHIGLVATVFIVSMISTFAGERVSWIHRLLISGLLATSCVLVFVYLLGQPIRLWWWQQ
jgi:lysylphosphatidylglycerol synthetase-like protein (DUF2156 family)